jgi:uncharacterized Tic20 family protein
MINPLPLRVRLLAAICHLSGMLWILAAIIYIGMLLSSGLGFGADGNYSKPIPAWYGKSLILIFCLPMLLWLLTRRAHDFVNRAATEVLNGQLSVLLYCIFILPFMVIACGVAVSLADQLGIHGTEYLGCFLPIGIVIYLAISTVGMIQALRGNVFRYPWIIHFLGSSD